MKKLTSYISLFILLAFCQNAIAQIDRTKAPEAAPAPTINIPEAAHFTLKNGLKVYVVENNKLPRIAFSLTLDKDPTLEKDKSGYTAMVGEMMRAGTKNRSKAELDEEIDFIGASLSTFSSGFYASSLTKHQDKLMELLTDVLFNPSFPEEELEKIIKRTKSGLESSKDDPNSIASNVRSVLLYGDDHPYGEITKEETVDNISMEDIKNYYNTYFKPNIGYLAIVGDISVKDAKKLTEKYFGKWAKADVPTATYNTPQAPEKTYVALVDRPNSVQSIINITYTLDLKPGDEDEIKARVLNQILGGGFSSRLMQNLREDKAYTYGARSSLSSNRLVGNFNANASVRNEVTDSAVHEFMYELNKIVEEGVTLDELNAAKASITGSFGRSLESPQTVASFAINIARYGLPKDYYQSYLKKLESITVEDIKETAKQYIKPNNAHIIVVGKADDIAENLAKFGEVKQFDIYGQPYTPAAKAEIPADMTAEKVLEKYIAAIGGKEKVMAIKNAKFDISLQAMGATLQTTLIKDQANGRFLQLQSMNGMVLSKQTLVGEELKVIAQGQNVPVPADLKHKAMWDASVFPEVAYKSLGATAELAGSGKVGDADAYKVKFTLVNDMVITHYYDIKSGLKLREEAPLKGPQGEIMTYIEYNDYQEVDGIKISQKQKVSQGFPATMEVKKVEFNTELSDSDFQ